MKSSVIVRLFVVVLLVGMMQMIYVHAVDSTNPADYRFFDNAENGTASANGWYSNTGNVFAYGAAHPFDGTHDLEGAGSNAVVYHNITGNVSNQTIDFEIYDNGGSFQYFGVGDMLGGGIVQVSIARNTGVSGTDYIVSDNGAHVTNIPLSVGFHMISVYFTSDQSTVRVKIDSQSVYNGTMGYTNVPNQVGMYSVTSETDYGDLFRAYNGTTPPQAVVSAFTYYNDSNNLVPSNGASVAGRYGLNFTENLLNSKLMSVQKTGSDTSVYAYLEDASGMVLDNATFIGDVANFTDLPVLNIGSIYRMESDNGVSARNVECLWTGSGEPSYPIVGVGINFTGANQGCGALTRPATFVEIQTITGAAVPNISFGTPVTGNNTPLQSVSINLSVSATGNINLTNCTMYSDGGNGGSLMLVGTTMLSGQNGTCTQNITLPGISQTVLYNFSISGVNGTTVTVNTPEFSIVSGILNGTNDFTKFANNPANFTSAYAGWEGLGGELSIMLQGATAFIMIHRQNDANNAHTLFLVRTNDLLNISNATHLTQFDGYTMTSFTRTGDNQYVLPDGHVYMTMRKDSDAHIYMFFNNTPDLLNWSVACGGSSIIADAVHYNTASYYNNATGVMDIAVDSAGAGFFTQFYNSTTPGNICSYALQGEVLPGLGSNSDWFTKTGNEYIIYAPHFNASGDAVIGMARGTSLLNMTLIQDDILANKSRQSWEIGTGSILDWSDPEIAWCTPGDAACLAYWGSSFYLAYLGDQQHDGFATDAFNRSWYQANDVLQPPPFSPYKLFDDAETGTATGNGWSVVVGSGSVAYGTAHPYNGTRDIEFSGSNSIACRNISGTANDQTVQWVFYDNGTTFQYSGVGLPTSSPEVSVARNEVVSASNYIISDGASSVTSVPLSVGFHNVSMYFDAALATVEVSLDGRLVYNGTNGYSGIPNEMCMYSVTGENDFIDNVVAFSGKVNVNTSPSADGVVALRKFIGNPMEYDPGNVFSAQHGTGTESGFFQDVTNDDEFWWITHRSLTNGGGGPPTMFLGNTSNPFNFTITKQLVDFGTTYSFTHVVTSSNDYPLINGSYYLYAGVWSTQAPHLFINNTPGLNNWTDACGGNALLPGVYYNAAIVNDNRTKVWNGLFESTGGYSIFANSTDGCNWTSYPLVNGSAHYDGLMDSGLLEYGDVNNSNNPVWIATPMHWNPSHTAVEILYARGNRLDNLTIESLLLSYVSPSAQSWEASHLITDGNIMVLRNGTYYVYYSGDENRTGVAIDAFDRPFYSAFNVVQLAAPEEVISNATNVTVIFNANDTITGMPIQNFTITFDGLPLPTTNGSVILSDEANDFDTYNFTASGYISQQTTYNFSMNTTIIIQAVPLHAELSNVSCGAVVFPNEDNLPSKANITVTGSLYEPQGIGHPIIMSYVNNSINIYENNNCNIYVINSTNDNFTCNMPIEYFTPAGAYDDNLNVTDGGIFVALNISGQCVVGELLASKRIGDVVNFPNVGPGSVNISGDKPIILRNTGNVKLNLSMTGYDLQSDVNTTLPATSFNAGAVLGGAVQLQNAIQKNLNMQVLAVNNSNGSVFMWLTMNAPIGSYHTVTPWQLIAIHG
jgi:hypothetical protein